MNQPNPNLGCIEFRHAFGADPTRRDAALARHRLECRGCGEYARGIETLDRILTVALAVPVPEGLAHRAFLRATAEPASRWARPMFAAAAALVLVAVGTVSYRNSGPAPTLAAEVLAHARHEPQSWSPALEPVAATRVRGVLAQSEIALIDSARLGFVSYARTCTLRGRTVPHLVVQSTAGPVMVLLLPDEKLAHEQVLDQDGWRGVLVPVGDGSIGIVAADPAAVEAVRQRVTQAIDLGI